MQEKSQRTHMNKKTILGVTSIDPPPLFKMGPNNDNVGILYLIVITDKVQFCSKFQPPHPLFHQKAEPHRFYQLRLPLTHKSLTPFPPLNQCSILNTFAIFQDFF